MNEGVPDCPDCGGKGMCEMHKVEYLEWIYKVARDAFEDALKKYKANLEERIRQNANTG
jgi:hypothetical protein